MDRQGGPNWANNWCVAPVIVDPESDEVYFTPLYYTMAHFSRFIRPGAVRIGFENTDETLMVTALRNPDSSIVLILFNPGEESLSAEIKIKQQTIASTIDRKAIQTIVVRGI